MTNRKADMEAERMLEKHRFCVCRTETVAYCKLFVSLMEDKREYFDVKSEARQRCIETALEEKRKTYPISGEESTLFYTLIIAAEENKSM